MKKKALVALVAVLAIAGSSLVIKWNFTGGWEGIYLLSGDTRGFEVTDDLFPEDSGRFIAGKSFGNTPNEHHNISAKNSKTHAVWNAKTGRGFIKNEYTDGRKLLINLSRFKTPEGVPQSGIFIGGGLPVSDPDYSANDMNETGMAYFDGKRWFHIWCYVNEAIAALSNPQIIVGPEKWRFVSSQLVENSSRELTIRSQHTAEIDGVPVKIVKYLFYEVGDSFFTLVTKVVNVGKRPVTLLYMYGDEPWLGDYGSSEGNVGWYKGGLVKTEQFIDTKTNTYAGFFDYGNDLAGERHNYTMKANFIEWERASRPESIYFSNHVGYLSPPGINGQTPILSSGDCRFVGLQWKQPLTPKQSFTFSLAIGMAENDPATGFPVKPRTHLN
jgi:hypothetical protein